MFTESTHQAASSSHALSAGMAAAPLPWSRESAAEVHLLRRLLADDEGAWREFNARYGRLIYRCITRVTVRFAGVVTAEDVREIQGMLCVQLLANNKRKLRTFEPGRGNKLGSWLGMLAVHTAYDYLRRVRREPRRGNVTEAESVSSELPDPFETLSMRERARIVAEMLAEFSPKDRQFITLYYGKGLDPAEVADRMEISVKTVYSKKHKIQARLEAILAERRLAA